MGFGGGDHEFSFACECEVPMSHSGPSMLSTQFDEQLWSTCGETWPGRVNLGFIDLLVAIWPGEWKSLLVFQNRKFHSGDWL